MEILRTLIPIVLMVSLSGLIVAVGMDADLGDLLHMLRRPLWLAKAVFAVNVLVPVAAVVTVFLVPLEPAAKAGVLLMSISPVPPLVPGKQMQAGAAKGSSYGLYVALVLLSIVTVPLAVVVLGSIYGRDVVLPPSAVARNVVLTVLLPLAFGLVIRRFAPAFARRAQPLLRTVSMLLLLLVLVPLVASVWSGIVDLAGNGTLAAMAAVSAIALLAGHLLGGPDPSDRPVLAFAAATRHPGIALMIARANFSDKQVAAAIVAFLLVGLVVAIPYQLWLKRRASAGAVTGS
jgi:BASS family bile acid:Na+ symporter